jgi:hypothetical protein
MEDIYKAVVKVEYDNAVRVFELGKLYLPTHEGFMHKALLSFGLPEHSDASLRIRGDDGQLTVVENITNVLLKASIVKPLHLTLSIAEEPQSTLPEAHQCPGVYDTVARKLHHVGVHVAPRELEVFLEELNVPLTRFVQTRVCTPSDLKAPSDAEIARLELEQRLSDTRYHRHPAYYHGAHLQAQSHAHTYPKSRASTCFPLLHEALRRRGVDLPSHTTAGLLHVLRINPRDMLGLGNVPAASDQRHSPSLGVDSVDTHAPAISSTYMKRGQRRLSVKPRPSSASPGAKSPTSRMVPITKLLPRHSALGTQSTSELPTRRLAELSAAVPQVRPVVRLKLVHRMQYNESGADLGSPAPVSIRERPHMHDSSK